MADNKRTTGAKAETRKPVDPEIVEAEEVTDAEDVSGVEEVAAEGDSHEAQTADVDDEDLADYVDKDLKSVYEKSYADVPKFETASEEDKEYMEDLIAEIDIWDENTIIDFGQGALKSLEEVGIRIQQKAERDGIFKEEMGNIESAVKDMNFSEAGERFVNIIKQKSLELGKNNAPEIAAGTIAGALTLNPLVGFGVGGALKAYRKYRQHKREQELENKTPEGIEDELRTSSVKLNRLQIALKEADKKIPEAIKEVNQLAEARREAFEEISLHIGAAMEKLKRVAHEEMAQAKRDYDKKPGFKTEEKLSQVTDAFNALDQKVTELYGTRTVFLTTTVQLGHLKKEYSRAHAKVRSHLTQSIPQWRSLISQVAKTLQLAEISKAIEAADDFADKLIEHNMTIQDETTKQIQNSSTRGTHDPEKLIEMTRRMTENLKALEDHARESRQSEQRLREELEASTKEMMQASVSYVKARASRTLEDASRITGEAAALEDKSTGTGAKGDFDPAASGKTPAKPVSGSATARRREAKRRNGPNLS